MHCAYQLCGSGAEEFDAGSLNVQLNRTERNNRKRLAPDRNTIESAFDLVFKGDFDEQVDDLLRS